MLTFGIKSHSIVGHHVLTRSWSFCGMQCICVCTMSCSILFFMTMISPSNHHWSVPPDTPSCDCITTTDCCIMAQSCINLIHWISKAIMISMWWERIWWTNYTGILEILVQGGLKIEKFILKVPAALDAQDRLCAHNLVPSGNVFIYFCGHSCSWKYNQ